MTSPRKAVRELARLRSSARNKHAFAALTEQPFDEKLLAISPLYRRSRAIFLETGGRFRAALLSSKRTLSSPTLLDHEIQYSPIESEMIWAATDRIESKLEAHLLELRTHSSSLFHEQNHRILWKMLPPCERSPNALRKYLNFAESLVIAADMALGDELGPKLAPLFYSIGATYDPGTDMRRLKLSRRQYRNYLQAAMYGTYLNLELYDPEKIPTAINYLFPGLGELAHRAALRAGNLDADFITKTNRAWQKKHQKIALKKLSSPRANATLKLSSDPLDHRVPYLLAEKWFEKIGL